MLSGNINGPSALPLLPDLNAALQAQAAASPAIPILVQRLDYATLRPDALTAGLLTAQNEQLYDVPGRTQSPYRVRTLFAAAPERNSVPTGNVSFVFPATLHVQSGGGSVQALSLDFGDGRGYLPATWGQPLAASYTTAGTKRVKVRVSYNANRPVIESESEIIQPRTTTYESHFDLVVLAPAAPAVASRYATDGFDYYIPARAGIHSGGKVTVRFGGAQGSRNRITKPLIVAEGYDPSSIAPKVQENYGIDEFLTSIQRFSFAGGGNFYNALQDQFGPNGYDIVFIDYNNGTDDIRRNAALFEEVVRWVNDQKVGGTSSGAQNVVLGISMGGLVARYGLAEMEKRGNDPTHTRLLLTHDAPHRGANTPLGLQALTRQAAGTLAGQLIRTYNSFGLPVFFPKLALFPELQQADDLLNAPATRQLLLVRATRQTVGAFSLFGSEYNTFVDGDYRAMITPNSGQVFPYAFKATSLGSQCGVGTLAPHSELVRIEGEGYMSIFLASAGIHTEIIVNAMPNSGRVERISGLRVWAQVRVLIFSRKLYLTRLDYQAPASNPIAWDGLPGGTQRINGQIDLTPGVSSGMWWQFPLPLFGYNSNVALANNFCFIPTASALDVPLFNNVTTRSSYISNATTGPSQPLASRFIAQGPAFDPNTGQATNNFEHPRFPGRQAQWMFNEMENNSAANVPLTCATECTLYPFVPIAGPDIICANNTSTTFTVAPPFGGVTGWSASPAGLVTLPSSTAGATSISVVPASGTSTGVVTLTASISNGCYNTTAIRKVAVGQGFLVVNDNQNNETCAIPSTEFAITEGYGAQGPYTWQVSAGYISGGQGTGQITVAGLPYQNYRLTVHVSSPASCPGTAPLEVSFYQDYATQLGGLFCPQYRSAASPPAPIATLYPNPAKETVDVHIENADATQPVTVRLFDGYGQPRAEQVSTGAATVRLKTDHLPAGLYFVHILRGSKVLSRQQLRIEK